MDPFLWIEFANSLAGDPVGDAPAAERLGDPKWLAGFLERCGVRHHARLDQRAMAKLVALRTLLLEMATSLAEGGNVDSASLTALNRHLAATAMSTHVELRPSDGDLATPARYRLRLRSTARNVDALLFTVAASFAAFLSEADSTRLRFCENPDCRWVFYDTTRSRTRRWCADSCGNLIKVRRFRAKAARGPDSA